MLATSYWRTPFKVLSVFFLGEVSSAFLPSTKACGMHKSGIFLQFLQWYTAILSIRRRLLGGSTLPAGARARAPTPAVLIAAACVSWGVAERPAASEAASTSPHAYATVPEAAEPNAC